MIVSALIWQFTSTATAEEEEVSQPCGATRGVRGDGPRSRKMVVVMVVVVLVC